MTHTYGRSERPAPMPREIYHDHFCWQCGKGFKSLSKIAKWCGFTCKRAWRAEKRKRTV